MPDQTPDGPAPGDRARTNQTGEDQKPVSQQAPAAEPTAQDVRVQEQPRSSVEPTTPPPVDPETTESASAETAAEQPASEAAPSGERQTEGAGPQPVSKGEAAEGGQEQAVEPDPEHEKAVARQVRDAEQHAAGEVPSFDVTLKIRRYDPEVAPEPRWEEFTVTVHGTDRLLDALHKVKWEQDGSLTFRRSCAHGVCGSDAMRINGRNRLACKTLCKDLNPDKPILVEPIKGLPVEKDLVVDMEPFFQSYREVMPFLITTGHEPTRERIQSQADRERFDDTTKCILCAACTSSCPVFWTDGQYFGPAAIVNAHRFIFDSRDEGADLRLEILNDREGVWRCRTTFNCTEACPRGIEVTKAIQEVKRALLTRKV